MLGGDWLLVHWGSLLMMCDRRNFADHPFRVVWQYPVSATITRISLVAEHLVLSVSKTVTVTDDNNAAAVAGAASGTATSQRAAESGHGSNGAVPDPDPDSESEPAPAATYNVTAAEVLILRLDKPEIVDSFPLPYTSGPVVAAKYSQCQSDGSHYGGLSYTSTHCYLMCPRGVYVGKPFPPRICSTTLLGCFAPPLLKGRGDEATHQCRLGCGSRLLSLSADVRPPDDVIAFEGTCYGCSSQAS